MSTRFPGRRLSPIRLAFLLLVIAAVIYAGFFQVRSYQDGRQAEGYLPWFGAYVDVTAMPSFDFESPGDEAEKNVILSFIVASEPGTCEASWGTYHTLAEAQSALELDRRIVRLGQFGGNIVISFGGEANTNLAVACETDALIEAYEAVIKRYEPAAIDLDIEGEALADAESRARRVEAVSALAAKGATDVPVWLTLPAGQAGLGPDAVAAVREFLDAGVVIAGVNAMTMNFTDTEANTPLAQPVIDSLRATHRQLKAIYADAGQDLGDQTLWRRIGATPMIGQNDTPGEVFTLDDARKLREFAREVGLGRLSVWSANRDRTCAPAYADLSVVSESCSGIDQADDSFRAILGEGFVGDPHGREADDTSEVPIHPEGMLDDPATSPYPIWNMHATYPADSRVVWRGNVYVARWWNSGMQPDDPDLGGSGTPWQHVGPVLEGEEPFEPLTLPQDFYPTWDPEIQYDRGDRVMLDEITYEAKWWTLADNPAAGQSDPAASPWRVLTQEEIEEILETID